MSVCNLPVRSPDSRNTDGSWTAIECSDPDGHRLVRFSPAAVTAPPMRARTIDSSNHASKQGRVVVVDRVLYAERVDELDKFGRTKDAEGTPHRGVLCTGAHGPLGQRVGGEQEHVAAEVINDLGVQPRRQHTSMSLAEEVADEIAAAGGKAIANNGRVTVTDNAKRIVVHAVHVFDGLDIVINNAGITGKGAWAGRALL